MGRFVQDADGAKGVELMFARTRTVVLVLLAIVAMHSAPAQEGGTSLPDKQQVEFYRDYAVISTTCQTWDEAYALAKRIVEKGGVVSTLLSPQRMLGWVPDSVRPAINGLDRISAIRTTVSMQKETAGGLYADNVSAGLDYFNNAKLGTIAKSPQSSLNAAGSSTATCLDGEDDVVLSSFLSQLGRMSDSAAKAQNVPAEVWQGRMKDSVQSLLGIPRGIMKGVIAVEVFMLESTGAGATHNWSTADERAQIAQTVRMFDFWSRRAAEYGHTLMFRGTWYRPSATTVVNVTGEPISMDKADDWRLIRQVMTNLGYANPFGDPGWGWVGSILTLGICLPCDLAAAWSVFPDGTEKEFVRVMKWNDRRSEEMRVDQTISLFIKLQPAGTNHRAYARSAGSGYVGGRVYIPELHINIDLPDMVIGPYAVLGTREGAPVIAHETAHLFGAPDEYRENTGDTDCPQPGYWFRGTPNRNCMVTNPTSVRALMRDNSEINFTNNELSGATPVFIGWTRTGIHGATTFSTTPAGIPITMDAGFESGPTFVGPRQIELAQGFTIPAVSVPPFVDISGTRYYFDAWYERAPGFSGVFTRTAWGATRSVRRDTAVAAYEARYTTTGGGITTANNTLEARLGMGPAVSGTRERIRTTGIVLVWRNTLSGSGGQYIPQQYLTGVWTDIPAGYYFAGSAAPGYWYAELSTAGIRDGSVNYFRVVPATAAGARGTPSNEVTIVTRNSTPLEDRYGSDIHEPNNTGASATPIAFNGSTDSSKTLDAAITYDALEEFGFSFDTDHYSLSSTALGGQSLRVTIMPKQGSIFHPYVTYKATAAAPAIEARRSVSGGWYFDVSSEGVSTFVVTSRRGSSDLIDFSTGIGNWGEYTITVRPVPPMLGDLSRLCPECRSIARIPAGGGRIYPFGTGIPAQRLFTQAGFPVSAPVPFGYIADADPGFEFKGWEGDLGGSKNPESRSLNPKTDLPGEHLLIAKFSPLPQGQYELVYDVPEAWKSVLGESKRTRGAMDEEFDIELPEAAMNGFDFLGWEGTLTASDIVAPSEWKVSPRIRVKLTRHLWVRPLIVPRPCTGGNPQAFTHALSVTSAKNDATILTYGMQAGAGDGLEAGQVELPPPPPTDIHDARFLNIDGAAQGSLTDVRAITPAHTFVGKVQPGDAGNPVRFAWAPIPASLPGTFLLTAGATLVNMRSTTSMTADLGSSSSFTIQVTQDTCRSFRARKSPLPFPTWMPRTSPSSADARASPTSRAIRS
ncbi:MAG: hypothetical protein IPP94_11325 [Ignavibacteria bacterium]|nr:hypothetical protein [Ignavibacteria bacterium]